MDKLTRRCKKSADAEEDEILSFEVFCEGDKRSSDMSLSDNVSYRLHSEREADTSPVPRDKETWLGADPARSRSAVTASTKKKSGRSSRGAGRVPSYRRFSDRHDREIYHVDCGALWSRVRWSALCVCLVLLCGAGVWWTVASSLGEAWSEEHYRRLWMRAHPPAHVVPATTPSAFYHDHNNLSINNRQNGSEGVSGRKRGGAQAGAAERCALNEEMRFDCHPEDGATEHACLERGCCWIVKRSTGDGGAHRPASEVGVPACFYPDPHVSYAFLNMTENARGLTVYYELAKPSPYVGDFKLARLQIRYISRDTLLIKITDAEHDRFEPPLPVLAEEGAEVLEGEAGSALLYRVDYEPDQHGLKVVRRADNLTILDTKVGGLVLSDGFLQMSSLLPTHTLYGLGERRGPLLLNTTWKRHVIFNRDTVPVEDSNLYGSHPFYLALEESGNSHGVFLLNSNAIEVVLQPTPGVTWRATGGVLQLLVVLGPSPRDVVAQYTALVGRPAMPPYWALGFHLCKYNYGSLNATREVWRRTREAGIPFDVQWNDLDYMSSGNDFTVDRTLFADLPAFVRDLHRAGMHYVPLIDAGVSAAEPPGQYPPYDVGLEMDIFIKNSSGLPFVGKVWNKVSTVWPDFTHPNITVYWLQMLRSLYDQVHFDGIWLDMNEPSNFLSGPLHGSCSPTPPPYQPHVADGALNTHTLCMDARHYGGSHADLHNLHGTLEAVSTHFALSELRGKRPFIISRASSPGLGEYAGHWSGDIASDWHDMRMTIPELLSFSLFGVPLMGADICGFRGNATAELCRRWMQLGAFYPFSRNHNSDSSSPQDPVALGEEVVAASRDSLRVRYAILPYLYTLFWRAYISGHTVATPMFFMFPKDRVTHALDAQFMLGPSLLVAPVLSPGASSVRVYLPDELWYAYNGSTRVPFVGWGELPDNQTLLIKGGSILVTQPPGEGPVTTTSCRERPLTLVVAPCRMSRAHGEFYWDDGESMTSWEERQYSSVVLSHERGVVRARVRWWGWDSVPPVAALLVLDQERPVAVTLAGRALPYTYSARSRLLTVHSLSLSLAHDFDLLWH